MELPIEEEDPPQPLPKEGDPPQPLPKEGDPPQPSLLREGEKDSVKFGGNEINLYLCRRYFIST